MSKFQIEKVIHSLNSIFSECCIVSYYPNSDTLLQVNFCDKENALRHSMHKESVGIWKPKSIKTKNNDQRN